MHFFLYIHSSATVKKKKNAYLFLPSFLFSLSLVSSMDHGTAQLSLSLSHFSFLSRKTTDLGYLFSLFVDPI